MNFKHEITGAVNVLLRYSQLAEQAIVSAWEDEDTMLTRTQVAYIHRALAEAKRNIGKAQERFKEFENVAEARKLTGV